MDLLAPRLQCARSLREDSREPETPGLEQRDEEIAAGLKTCASIMPSFVIAGSPRAVGMASVEQ
jgi:hypothetical protein